MSGIRYVLAVDIGTSHTKGIVLDGNARVVGSASVSHSDTGAHPGWHEQDAEQVWWEESVAVIRALLSTSALSASAIECLCITGMFPNFCPADEQGHPLCKALLYDDSRAVEFAPQLRSQGIPVSEGNELLARLLWFRSAFPEKQARLRRIFSTHNYVVYRLTGRYCVDGHTAYLFGSVFDPVKFSWRASELQQIGIEEDLLPEVLPPQAIAGPLTVEAARATGLSSGIPVLVGTGDIFASLLSSGAHKPGQIMVHYGSSGLFLQLTSDFTYILGATSYKDGDDGLKLIAGLPRSGKRLEWFSNLAGQLELNAAAPDLLGYFDIAINPSEPAKSDTLFFYDIDQPQEFASVTSPFATFLAIPLGVTTLDLYRSMLEGFGYRLRYKAEGIGLTDSQASWYAAGGGIRSTTWCQIVTDIVDRTQTVCQDAESALGAALIASYTAGLFDLSAVIEQRIEAAKIYRPQAQLRYLYDDRYSKYLRALKLLQSYREQFYRRQENIQAP